MLNQIVDLLGEEAETLLGHRCETVAKESLRLPGPDGVDRFFVPSDRNPRVLGACARRYAHRINSGGASSGDSDLAQAVRTAVINKRAGGMGLISGRKAFQRPMEEGAKLLHAIQDVYLENEVTIA